MIGLDEMSYNMGSDGPASPHFVRKVDHFIPLREAIRGVLLAPFNHQWTFHGLGMIRCYPFGGRNWRLNVWHRDFKSVPPASELHDHPWDLESYVMGGTLTNTRYVPVFSKEPLSAEEFHDVRRYNWRLVGCGPNDTNMGNAGGQCFLGRKRAETYFAGAVYRQLAHEVHFTDYQDGTVTLMQRSPAALDSPIQDRPKDTARIFWPIGTEWVDAAPRPATSEEVELGCSVAARVL